MADVDRRQVAFVCQPLARRQVDAERDNGEKSEEKTKSTFKLDSVVCVCVTDRKRRKDNDTGRATKELSR